MRAAARLRPVVPRVDHRQRELGLAVAQVVEDALQLDRFVADLFRAFAADVDGQQVVGRAELYPVAGEVDQHLVAALHPPPAVCGRPRAAALARLIEMIAAASVRPKVRRATKPTYSSKLKRLEGKTRRAGVKAGRGKVTFHD